MKKQLILGSFLALSGIANAQWSGLTDIYNTAGGNVGIGGAPAGMKLEVFSYGPDNGIEVITPPGSADHDAVLRLYNQTSDGHDYWLSSSGYGHTPTSIEGALHLWDATAGASRMIVSAEGNIGFGTQTPDDSKVHAIANYQTNTGAAFKSGGLFETTANDWGVYIGTKSTVNQNYTGNNVTSCFGVWGESNSSYANQRTNTGVSGTARDGKYNRGGYFEASGWTAGTTNVGIYAIANNGSNAASDWAAHLDGRVLISGDLWHNGTFIFSDRRVKKNIKSLENVREKINKLNGYTYNYRSDEFKEKHFDDKSHIGLIAQEIKEVFPELVNEDLDGIFSVNYDGMIPVLLEAIKEQYKAGEVQQQQITELKALVNSLAGSTTKGGAATGTPVQLSDKNAIVLDQNVPNPFAESTVISYNIPTDFTRAQIIFATSDGKIIKTVNITEKGANTLNVFGNDLSTGIYTYSLVVDGKTIDTKKMVKE